MRDNTVFIYGEKIELIFGGVITELSRVSRTKRGVKDDVKKADEKFPCRYYGACLNIAIKKNWWDFSCRANCPFFGKDEHKEDFILFSKNNGDMFEFEEVIDREEEHDCRA